MNNDNLRLAVQQALEEIRGQIKSPTALVPVTDKTDLNDPSKLVLAEVVDVKKVVATATGSLRPGDEFMIRAGRGADGPWILLEQKKSRVWALNTSNLRIASMPKDGTVFSTGVSHRNLIDAIENAYSRLMPGERIHVESIEMVITRVGRGTIYAKDTNGTVFQISEWSPAWWSASIMAELVHSSTASPTKCDSNMPATDTARGASERCHSNLK